MSDPRVQLELPSSGFLTRRWRFQYLDPDKRFKNVSCYLSPIRGDGDGRVSMPPRYSWPTFELPRELAQELDGRIYELPDVLTFTLTTIVEVSGTLTLEDKADDS